MYNQYVAPPTARERNFLVCIKKCILKQTVRYCCGLAILFVNSNITTFSEENCYIQYYFKFSIQSLQDSVILNPELDFRCDGGAATKRASHIGELFHVYDEKEKPSLECTNRWCPTTVFLGVRGLASLLKCCVLGVGLMKNSRFSESDTWRRYVHRLN